jgi:lipoprotein-anchoring transpeptidase ErfK/SrfK
MIATLTHPRVRTAAALATAALALAPAAARGAEACPSPADPDACPPAQGADTRMSDERTVTRWAHANDRGAVRHAPRTSAGIVARLRYQTEDRMPEVYVALRARTDGAGRTWIQVRVPRRPNGTVGWVRRSSLGGFHVVRTHLTIDKRRLRATLRKAGRTIWTSRIGIGAPGTPTPSGSFYIRERLRGSGGVYGPWAFGTSAYSRLSDWPGGGVIGIHGTNQPRLIPGRPSHGCIRVPNGNIRRLARLMPVGTPVRIR